MNVSEMDEIRTRSQSLEAVVAPADEAVGHEECEQCGAPVDSSQRYCVNCGAHRHHVPDPAARYLAQTSARARIGLSPAGRPPTRRRSPLSPLTAAFLAAVLAGGGVAVGAATTGGSSNNPQLVQALHRLEQGGGSHATTTAGHSGKAKPAGSAVKHLQHATGSNYVNQAKQLPNSVSIP